MVAVLQTGAKSFSVVCIPPPPFMAQRFASHSGLNSAEEIVKEWQPAFVCVEKALWRPGWG